ncbi:hypothetical protein [Grimontia marina]|uniref:Uncharacterized protein n=1 Tax=Grimontia marina TaxID=646534 RepID=A0A128EYS0_9GAMM|nr:hypothetical protein [Grimontia marina]CZF79405.1 hypothetical protein GMA8713_00958 [Grimontia marina]
MAAEKLTTGRLVQILVVMAVLITAFIWRTLEHNEPATMVKCSVVVGACSVSLNAETIEIKTENQDDNSRVLVVNSVYEPGELRLLGDPEIVITSQKIMKSAGEKSAYIYALPDDVKYESTQKWILIIDRDQLVINF